MPSLGDGRRGYALDAALKIGDLYEDRNCALPDLREQQGPGRESRGSDQEATGD
jgi:hypothetical protein